MVLRGGLGPDAPTFASLDSAVCRSIRQRLSVVVVADPYSDTRTGPELVEGPGLLLAGGIQGLLEGMDCDLVQVTTVQMPPELEREYGEWNRASLTNRTLGKIIYESDQGEHFFVGPPVGQQIVGGNAGRFTAPGTR